MGLKLTKKERRFIKEHCDSLSAEEIAKKLQVDVSVVREAIKEMKLKKAIPSQLKPAKKEEYRTLTKIEFLLGLPAFLIPLIVYALTFCRTLYVGDSGEFNAMGHTLGIAHPPGYPMWVLLLKLADTFLPLPNVAARCNFFSSLIAAVTVYFLYLLLLKLGRERIPALIGSLTFAFTLQFWSQALIAEVYGMNAMYILVSMLILLLWNESKEDRYLYLLYLVSGMALAHHNTFLAMPIFFSPFIICALKPEWHFKQEAIYTLIYYLITVPALYVLSGVLGNAISLIVLREPLPPTDTFMTKALLCILAFVFYTLALHWWYTRKRVWLYASLLFFLGVFLYAYIPLRAKGNPLLSWGYPKTIQDFYNHISRRQYGPLSQMPRVFPSSESQTLGFGPWDLVKEQFGTYVILTLRQFGSYLGGIKGWVPPLFLKLFHPEGTGPKGISFILNLIWTFIWVSLSCIGAWRLLKEHGKFFFITLMTFLMFGPGLIPLLNYNTTNHQMYIQEVFFIPHYLIISLWLGLGVGKAINWIQNKINLMEIAQLQLKQASVNANPTLTQNNPTANADELITATKPISSVYSITAIVSAGLLFLIPVVPLLANYYENDLSRNAVAYDFGMNILESMDKNGILFIIGDNPTFSVLYLLYAAKVRQDVTVYDEGENLFNMIYDFGDKKYKIGPEEHNRLKDLGRKNIILNNPNRPCYFMTDMPEFIARYLPGYRTVPCGILYRVLRPGEPEPDFIGTLSRLRDLDKYFTDMSTDYYTRELIANYHFLVGRGYYEVAKRKNDPEMLEEAFAEFRRTGETGWDLDNMHVNLGNFFSVEGRIDEAIKQYEHAIKVQPRKAITYFSLAGFYERLGERQKAIKLFEKGISLANYPEAGANDVRAFASLGHLYLLEAADSLRSTTLSPTEIEYKKRTNAESAVAYFQRVISSLLTTPPEDRNIDLLMESYVQLGLAYQLLGQYDLAVEMYKKPLEINPNYPSSLYNLAMFYQTFGNNPEKAAEYWARFQSATQVNQPKIQPRSSK